jgi:pre-mRNA-splicing factor 38B
MEIEDNEVKHLINHGDSPYIRALGFLYVRYVLHTGPHTTPFAW